MSDRRQEVIEKIGALVKSRFGGDLKTAFDSYDSEKSGSLSGDEVYAVLSDAGIGNRFTRGMYVKEIIRTIDTNEDAEVSWDEFQAVLQ